MVLLFMYFNPPAPCGAGPVRAAMSEGGVPISIHPPLAGRDQISAQQIVTTKISIHPPLAGRDLTDTVISFSSMYFNPPAPCGAGPPLIIKVVIQWLFQSTRPLRGGTHKISACEPAERFQSTRPLRGGTAILHKKTVQNIAYCTKSAFTLAVLSGFLALMRPFFLPNVHKFRCEPSEESLLAPRSHAYTIRTPSG